MIRRFKQEDALACSKIIAECIDKQVELSLEAKEYIKSKTTPKHLVERSKRILIFVYEDEGKVLGIGALDKNEIRTLFTKIGHQAKGIGSMILNRLETEAKKSGYKKVFVHAALNSEAFYRKRGYVFVKRVAKKKDSVIIESVLMEKSL
ncbi:hypothetical protein DRJ48_02890 [Candidatus Woesearchaeota archaeon]|nr:MAG: hypothetical protein DRJ48_02890 [Candidatus Woesearchaeota archaeon]